MYKVDDIKIIWQFTMFEIIKQEIKGQYFPQNHLIITLDEKYKTGCLWLTAQGKALAT